MCVKRVCLWRFPDNMLDTFSLIFAIEPDFQLRDLKRRARAKSGKFTM
jgi:hypothetical protein